jgi:hypothetical protein
VAVDGRGEEAADIVGLAAPPEPLPVTGAVSVAGPPSNSLQDLDIPAKARRLQNALQLSPEGLVRISCSLRLRRVAIRRESP